MIVVTVFLLCVTSSQSVMTRPPTRAPTTLAPSANIDYSCIHSTSWLVNTNGQYSDKYATTSDVTTSGFVNTTTVTTGWQATFTGIPFYGHVMTTAEITKLNSRPDASSDFTGGATTAVAGTYYDYGEDIGYSSRTCGDGYWPSGPSCPAAYNGSYTFTVFPSPETGDCYVPAHSGYFVNGVPFWSWTDATTYNDEDVWYNCAMEFEQYDMDVCVGHSASGVYHHHSVSPCLMIQLNDTGDGHSPVHGFAYDGYPIYGPYQAANTLAVSCWQARDYDDATVGCSGGKRTCVFVDQYDYTKGTTTASSSGPDPSSTVDTQSGNTIDATSGVYFQDYFLNSTCTELGENYLDSFNGHSHGSYKYHYHLTMDSSGKPTFPYTMGPKYYGCRPIGACQTGITSGSGTSKCTTSQTQKAGACTKYVSSPAISYPTMGPTTTITTRSPTIAPTTGVPSISPTRPTRSPSRGPTLVPTTIAPSIVPTGSPLSPTQPPTINPSQKPTTSPSVNPTVTPSISPSIAPSVSPSIFPSIKPSAAPTTIAPSMSPTILPSALPTSTAPSCSPTINPSQKPSVEPTITPTEAPTLSIRPSMSPTIAPSPVPSIQPSLSPTVVPSIAPSVLPSVEPSISPSESPTITPTNAPSIEPTLFPSEIPTIEPSIQPSESPSLSIPPSEEPSIAPTEEPTIEPTFEPSNSPTLVPTAIPTAVPSYQSRPIISFTVSITMSGLTSSTLDDAAEDAIVSATASSLGISTTYVTFSGSTTESRRLLKSRLLDTTYTITATSDVVIPLINIVTDDDYNVTAIYYSLKSSFDSAVTSGDFASYLTAASIALGATSTLNITVIAHSVSSLSVADSPTFQPTDKPNSTSSSELTGMALYLTVALCVGGGFVILIFLAYYFGFKNAGPEPPKSNALHGLAMHRPPVTPRSPSLSTPKPPTPVATSTNTPKSPKTSSPVSNEEVQLVVNHGNAMGF